MSSDNMNEGTDKMEADLGAGAVLFSRSTNPITFLPFMQIYDVSRTDTSSHFGFIMHILDPTEEAHREDAPVTPNQISQVFTISEDGGSNVYDIQTVMNEHDMLDVTQQGTDLNVSSIVSVIELVPGSLLNIVSVARDESTILAEQEIPEDKATENRQLIREMLREFTSVMPKPLLQVSTFVEDSESHINDINVVVDEHGILDTIQRGIDLNASLVIPVLELLPSPILDVTSADQDELNTLAKQKQTEEKTIISQLLMKEISEENAGIETVTTTLPVVLTGVDLQVTDIEQTTGLDEFMPIQNVRHQTLFHTAETVTEFLDNALLAPGGTQEISPLFSAHPINVYGIDIQQTVEGTPHTLNVDGNLSMSSLQISLGERLVPDTENQLHNIITFDNIQLIEMIENERLFALTGQSQTPLYPIATPVIIPETKEPPVLSMFVKPSEMSIHSSESGSLPSWQSMSSSTTGELDDISSSDEPQQEKEVMQSKTSLDSTKRQKWVKKTRPAINMPTIEEVETKVFNDNFNIYDKLAERIYDASAKNHEASITNVVDNLDELESYICDAIDIKKKTALRVRNKIKADVTTKQIVRKPVIEVKTRMLNTGSKVSSYNLSSTHFDEEELEISDNKFVDKIMRYQTDNKIYTFDTEIAQFQDYVLAVKAYDSHLNTLVSNAFLSRMLNIYSLLSELPKRYHNTTKLAIVRILTNVLTQPQKALELLDDNEKYFYIKQNLENELVKKLLLLDVSATVTERQIYTMDYVGDISTSGESVVLMDSRGIQISKLTLGAHKITIDQTETPKDEFIGQLLSKSRMVILDYENMVKAMKINPEDIEKFCDYLSSWGVTTIVVTRFDDAIIHGPSLTLQIGTEAHDDIAILMASRVNKAIVITSDSYSEFMNMYTYCTKHNHLITRKNETCPHSSTNLCRLVIIKKKLVGSVAIRKLVVRSGKIVSLQAHKRLFSRTIGNKEFAFKVMKLQYNSTVIPVISHKWCMNTNLSEYPFIANSIKTNLLRSSITLVQFSFSNIAKCIFTTNATIAIVSALEALGTPGLAELKLKLDLYLTVSNSNIVVVREKDKRTMSVNTKPRVDANLYSDAGTRVYANLFNAVALCNTKMSVSTINEEITLNEGHIDLSETTMIITTDLLDNDVCVLESKGKYTIVKLDPGLATAIEKSAVTYVMDKATTKADAAYVLPLSDTIKAAITSQYASRDSVEEGMSNDASIIHKKNIGKSSLLFSYVDADKPSKQLFHNPDTTTFVMSTLGLQYVDVSSGKPRVIINSEPGKLEHLSHGEATAIYTKWESISDNPIQIEISTVHWTSAGIRSLNCNKEDIEAIRIGVHTVTETIIRDVTRDIINIFTILYKGKSFIALPALVRGCKMPWLTLKEEAPAIAVQINWALPTCSCMSRLIISHDKDKSVYTALVSVSPPITHNYIAAMLNNDLTLENEYNVLICEQVEMETYGLFEYLCGKEDYMSVYFAAYGIYSLGLKMFGVDPITAIMKSSSSIETGEYDISALLATANLQTIAQPASLDVFLRESMMSGKVNVLKLSSKRTLWNRPRDIHLAIKVLAETRLINDYNKFVIVYTISQVICGRDHIFEHIKRCWCMKIKYKISSAKDFYVIMNTQMAQHLLTNSICLLPDCEPLPILTTPQFTNQSESALAFNYMDSIVTLETYRSTKRSHRRVAHNIGPCVPYIPLQGRVLLGIINNKNQTRYKTVRLRNLPTILKEIPQLIASVHYETISNINEVYPAINNLISIANKTKSALVLHAFDKLGPLYKQLSPDERKTIYIPQSMLLYIPDRLLYNSIRYNVTYSEEETMPKIMSDENEYEHKDILTDPTGLTKNKEEMNLNVIFKLVVVALLLACIVFFFPQTKMLLSLPFTLWNHFYPPTVVSTTTVSWFGSVIGVKPVVTYSVLSNATKWLLWTLTGLWDVAVAALSLGLGKLFFETTWF